MNDWDKKAAVLAFVWLLLLVAAGPALSDTSTIGRGAQFVPVSVQPSGAQLPCGDGFDITISNVSDGELVIHDIELWHAYSQGWYGTGFTWDLSHIRLPAVLAPAESLTFPVVYDPTGQRFASGLHLTVDMGANNNRIDGTYYGGRTEPGWMELACGPCVGDCNRDGSVTIDELLHGLGEALGYPVTSCSEWAQRYATFCDSCGLAFDRDYDAHLEISELIAAVHVLLDGCPAD